MRLKTVRCRFEHSPSVLVNPTHSPLRCLHYSPYFRTNAYPKTRSHMCVGSHTHDPGGVLMTLMTLTLTGNKGLRAQHQSV